MIARCYYPNQTGYENYGGKGISVCERWRDSLDHFITDMGLPPSKEHTIDRIDGGGNYEPGNCRWASRIVQARNRHFVTRATINGVTKTIPDWCEEFGICNKVVNYRINALKWDPIQAITTPKLAPGRCRNNVKWTIDGVTKTASEWCADYGRKLRVVRGRIRTGWSIKDAVTLPPMKPGPNRKPR